MRLGDKNVTSHEDNLTVVIRSITNIVIHPNFTFPQSYYDVAILEMDRPVAFSPFVKPICLPESPVSYVDNHMSDFVTLTGWGKEKKNSNDIDGLLKQVPIKIFSQRYCNRSHYIRERNALFQTQIRLAIPDLFQSNILCAGGS